MITDASDATHSDTFFSGPTSPSPSDPFAIYADPLDALERATDTRIYNSPDLGNFESAEVVVDMRRKKKKKVRVARLLALIQSPKLFIHCS